MSSLTLIRKRCGLRLRQVAEQLDLTIQTVQQQEKRGIRSVRTAKRYAEVFNCDWRELFDDGMADLPLPVMVPKTGQREKGRRAAGLE